VFQEQLRGRLDGQWGINDCFHSNVTQHRIDGAGYIESIVVGEGITADETEIIYQRSMK
jgi:hypothetical protein